MHQGSVETHALRLNKFPGKLIILSSRVREAKHGLLQRYYIDFIVEASREPFLFYQAIYGYIRSS